MPELPEVEALTAYLRQRAVGHAITRVDLAAFNALKTVEHPIEAVVGRTVADVRRYGKFLDLVCASPAASAAAPLAAPLAAPIAASTAASTADQGSAAAGESTAVSPEAAATEGSAGSGSLHLVVHLARAGWLRWSDELPTAPPKPGRGPIACRVHLDNGSGFTLTEAGTQKRLAVYLVDDVATVPGVARLGPDPLADGFGPEQLAEVLQRAGRAQLKGALTDQTRIAGVGNAYSDEILHAARLSPFKPANGLSAPEQERLYAALRGQLFDALERSRGLPATDVKAQKRSGMAVHGRTGEACPVCGDVVREVSFADSSLQYCATCQTGGKPLADRRMSKLLK